MKVKAEFLWYMPGDEIKKEDEEHIAKWKEEGLVEESEEVKAPEKPKEQKKEEKPKAKSKGKKK